MQVTCILFKCAKFHLFFLLFFLKLSGTFINLSGNLIILSGTLINLSGTLIKTIKWKFNSLRGTFINLRGTLNKTHYRHSQLNVDFLLRVVGGNL